MFLDHRAVRRAQLGARRVEIGAGREPAEQLRHPVHAAGHHRRRQVMRAGHDVGDDLGLRRIRHRRLEHADDGRRAVAEADGLADDRRIALERRVQNRWVSTAAPAASGRRRRAEQTAEHRPKAHHVEVRAADDAGADHARLAQADHREADGGEIAEGGQRLDAGAQVLDLGDREVGVLGADSGRALADVDQPVLVAVDERPQ